MLRTLPDESVHCVVTSPPYWGLRDYGVPGQMGLEPTLGEHIEAMVAVFREVRRVLRKDGTCWLNYWDCYNGSATRTNDKFNARWGNAEGARKQECGRSVIVRDIKGLKPKDLCMIPNRLAIALQDDGWWVRSEIIWAKPNPMPESVTDRPTSAHEKIFLLTKSARYFYDAEAVREPHLEPHRSTGKIEGVAARDPGPSMARPDFRSGGKPRIYNENGRNLRNVWTVPTRGYKEAHFATFPPDLIVPCIKAGCPRGGLVLDPFAGAGTVGLVADRLQRAAILIELNPEYCRMAKARIEAEMGMFGAVTMEPLNA